MIELCSSCLRVIPKDSWKEVEITDVDFPVKDISKYIKLRSVCVCGCPTIKYVPKEQKQKDALHSRWLNAMSISLKYVIGVKSVEEEFGRSPLPYENCRCVPGTETLYNLAYIEYWERVDSKLQEKKMRVVMFDPTLVPEKNDMKRIKYIIYKIDPPESPQFMSVVCVLVFGFFTYIIYQLIISLIYRG